MNKYSGSFIGAFRAKEYGGQTRTAQKEVLVKLVDIQNSIAVATSASALISTPSRRLSMIAEVFFDMNEGQTETYQLPTAYNATWEITAMANGARGNGLVELHDIISSANNPAKEYTLPNAYEFDTAIRQVRVTVTTTDNPSANSGAYTYNEGAWWLRVRWEPNLPGIDPQELEMLLSSCNVSYETARHIDES